MVIYTKLIITGSTYTDIENLTVTKNTGENNATSSFGCQLPNFDGKHKDDFEVGDEVLVYAEKDVNPPTTKIFTGIIEEKNFFGQGTNERIKLSGRDYTARLIDSTVPPEVYNNQYAGSIVQDIMNKYIEDVSWSGVQISNTILKHVAFNHKPVFDAIEYLAKQSNYYFYVDNNKDLHFEEKASTSSNKTLDSGNVIRADFREDDSDIRNKVWVYGHRYLVGWENDFTGDGAGSIFALDYNPHSTRVTVAGSIQRGYVFEMVIGDVVSGTQYLIDYDQKKLIFVSGTAPGDNIPASGDAVICEYDRSVPIVKYGENAASIIAHGPASYVIVDRDIRQPSMAEEILVDTLSRYGEPFTEGNLDVKGIVDLTPGNTIKVNLPNEEVSDETYDIISLSYDFKKDKCLRDQVLKVKVNEKIRDMSDTIKQIILDIKKLQQADAYEVMTRYEFVTGSTGLRVSDWYAYDRDIGSSFVLGHPVNGILGAVGGGSLQPVLGSGTIGTWTAQASGGTWT